MRVAWVTSSLGLMSAHYFQQRYKQPIYKNYMPPNLSKPMSSVSATPVAPVIADANKATTTSAKIETQSDVGKVETLTPEQWQAALDHMDSVERYIMEFAGKEDMNPYMFLNKNIVPLRQQFEAGIRTPALYMKIMSLEKKEPVAPDNKFQSRV